MENKYYTPELSDIFVGQEVWVRGFAKTEKHVIILEDLVNFVKMNSPLYKGIPTSLKYLDKEDIESLGWMLTKDYSDSGEGFRFQLQVDDSKFYEMEFENNETLGGVKIERWSVSDMGGCSYILFDGVLKNKGQLKQIMSQLNITK